MLSLIIRLGPRERRDEPKQVRFARQRDRATWSAIYTCHYPDIYRYVYGRLGPEGDAEDIASQVFLEALQSIDSYRDRGKPLLTWLYGIARNLVNDRVRRARLQAQSVRKQTEQYLRDEAEQTGISADGVDLARALEVLTDDQRDVLVLRFYGGKTAREVAATMGKTEEAVYGLQVRGISSMRRFLNGKRAA